MQGSRDLLVFVKLLLCSSIKIVPYFDDSGQRPVLDLVAMTICFLRFITKRCSMGMANGKISP